MIVLLTAVTTNKCPSFLPALSVLMCSLKYRQEEFGGVPTSPALIRHGPESMFRSDQKAYLHMLSLVGSMLGTRK